MIAGVGAVPLGQTEDGRFGQRLVVLGRNAVNPRAAKAITEKADVIVARNLEMLALGARIRRREQPLVYECLDIHRLMLRHDLVGRAFRKAERWLLRRVNLLITSSPAYLTRHFEEGQGWAGPSILAENKILDLEACFPTPVASPPGPPWRIGWFGMLRDPKSLAILKELVERSEGRVELLLAGRPARREFPQLEQELVGLQGVSFVGPYLTDDLHRLYGDVHFAWCVDFFEEGANANWSMANRQYESLAHGAVPIGQATVETGRWLQRLGVGVRLGVFPNDLFAFFERLRPDEYRKLQQAVLAVPATAVRTSRNECGEIVRAMAKLGL
jgi:hypothetical protein